MVSGIVTINDSIYEKNYGKKISYYLEPRLKIRTDQKIRGVLKQDDKDFFAIVDGKEGSGKSWFSFQWAKYVDNTFNLKRIVFSPEEFKQAIFKAKKGQAIVYDEAFTGLSSRSSLSGINRYLVSLAMQIRQKNLFVILVLPSVFLLDKYFVMFRAKCLVHVYENKKFGRGYFKIFNNAKIKQLIIAGKATYSYSVKVKTRFKGRFYGKFALGDENEQKYRDMKSKALENAEKNPMSAGQIKYREQRDLVLFLLRKNTSMTYEQLANLLNDYDFEITYVQISRICAKFGDKSDKNDKLDKKTNKKNESESKVIDIDEKEQLSDEKVLESMFSV